MLLGREFLENVDRYHVCTDITSRAFASLLDLGGQKVDIVLLLRKVFKENFLEDDVELAVFAELGVGIPWPRDIPQLLEPDRNVARQPFLLNLNDEQLTRHRKWARLGRDFLRKWFFFEELDEPYYTWLEEFSEIILSGKFYTDDREE
jgi:hypothetical protein